MKYVWVYVIIALFGGVMLGKVSVKPKVIEKEVKVYGLPEGISIVSFCENLFGEQYVKSQKEWQRQEQEKLESYQAGFKAGLHNKWNKIN